MKIFEGFNETGPACPVCQTQEDKPCTLVPIYGTNSDDSPLTYMAEAIHVDCLDLLGYKTKDKKLYIIQKIGGDDGK